MDKTGIDAAVPATRRQTKGQTGLGGTVILVWVILLAWSTRNTLFVRPRAADSFMAIDTAAGIQIALVMLAGIVIVLSGRAQIGLLGPPGSAIRPLMIYYGLCALSFAWSALPMYTLYRAGEALILLTATFGAVSACRTFQQAERIFLVVSLVTILLSMGQNVVLHGIGDMSSLRAWHTNTYTAVGAVLAVYCFGEYRHANPERRRLLRRAGMLGFGAVILGTSSASNISLVAGLMVVAVIQGRHVLLALLVLAGAVLFGYLVLAEGGIFALFDWLFPGKDEAAVASLGGRTRIWEFYWDAFLRSPLLGSGFAVLELETGKAIRLYSHNSYFAVILGTALLGVFAAGAFLIRLVGHSLRYVRKKRAGAIGGAGALATGFINSNAMPMILDQWEESVLAFATLIAFMVFFVWRKPSNRRRQARQEILSIL